MGTFLVKLMALTPVKRHSISPRRPSATSLAPAAGSPPYSSRISHSDELQLACRLAECRRELLAIALHDPRSIAELFRIQLELTSGLLSAGAVMEAASSPASSARQQFESWVHAAQALQRDTAAEWSLLVNEAPAVTAPVDRTGPAAGALPPRARDLLQKAAELVNGLPLDADAVERLIQSAWGPAGASASRFAELPAVLERRAVQLEAEAEAIRRRFITANQGLVAHVVQRYRGMGLSREDLMQEGNIGLLRAIEKYDHRRGTRFGAYAIWWIRQGVRRALANQSRTIRIPVHALGTRYTLDQAAKRLALELGRKPSEQELSSATGVGPASISHVLGLVKEPLSLDAPRGPENDACLGDSVADVGAPSPSDHAMSRERAEQLHGLLDGLSAREREMLRMRFGLDGADECTLEEIGRSFALTRERVRQIVTAALGKLHRQTQLRDLELATTE
jgi:RNA polymerase sigma factor (sigma-70 family)